MDRWRWCFLAPLLLIWWHAAGPGAHAGYDFFTAYYSAASQVARGINPYQPLVKLSIDPELGGLLGRGYVYPPLLATLLAVPIRIGFNARACWLLWTLVNAVALIWMGRELNLNLRDSRSWTGTMAFCVACLLPAVVTYDLFLGQADLLMAALAVGACALRLRGRSWLGALVLGLAIAIKPTLGLLLLVWVWKGDWRAALRGALAASIFIFLPFTLIGMAALQEYLGFLLHWNAFGANADFINQTPYALLLRIFTVNPSTRPGASCAQPSHATSDSYDGGSGTDPAAGDAAQTGRAYARHVYLPPGVAADSVAKSAHRGHTLHNSCTHSGGL